MLQPPHHIHPLLDSGSTGKSRLPGQVRRRLLQRPLLRKTQGPASPKHEQPTVTGTGALARSGRRAAAALLVAVAACLALPLQAVTLVNNSSEPTTANTSVGGSSNFLQAQKFTVPTGQDYSLDDVTIRVSTRSADGLVVSIRDGSAADPPGTALYTLIDPVSPGTGNQVYSAPAGAVLAGGNNYFVMLERAQSTGNTTVGIDKLTEKSPFWPRFVFAHKIQLVDYRSYLFFNSV